MTNHNLTYRVRYFYATGYRTREAAEAALEDCYATGEVSEAEWPLVESYKAKDGSKRFGVSMRG